jgi:opacity protein-like surface antigen
MKKIVLLSLVLMVVFASTSLYAAEKYSLGMGNIALKVDYINFTEDAFEDIEIENGVYVGLEGYYAIYPNLYLGLEAGWAGAENDNDIEIEGEQVNVDVDVTYVPVELNLKYAFELGPNWVMDLGAGISYNFFQVELNRLDVDEDDWVLGGQVFADINYKLSSQWFIGINGKYQFTDDLELEAKDQDIKKDVSADNWRVGAQVGLMF